MTMSNGALPDGLDAGSLGRVLEGFTWRREQTVPDRFEIWGDGAGVEVLVPLADDRPDYARLLSQAWRAVQTQYGDAARESLEQLTAVARGLLDTTHWKKETSLAAGLIAWSQGSSLFDAAEKSLVAAAKSTRESRFYHGTASSHIAKRFLEASLMGQTEIGSFIITAHTPSNERFHLSRHSEEAASTNPRKAHTVTGRQILDTLATALDAVQEVLPSQRKTPDVDAMLDLKRAGVSHELLIALAEVTASAESAVEIERVGHNAPPQRVEFAFEPVDSPLLTRAALRFAESGEPTVETVSGEVTLLSHVSGDPHHVIRIDSGRGKVRVRLNAEQYKDALEAHATEGALLQARGKVVREGRNSWIYNPERVDLVPPPDEGAAPAVSDPLF